MPVKCSKRYLTQITLLLRAGTQRGTVVTAGSYLNCKTSHSSIVQDSHSFTHAFKLSFSVCMCHCEFFQAPESYKDVNNVVNTCKYYFYVLEEMSGCSRNTNTCRAKFLFGTLMVDMHCCVKTKKNSYSHRSKELSIVYKLRHCL